MCQSEATRSAAYGPHVAVEDRVFFRFSCGGRGSGGSKGGGSNGGSIGGPSGGSSGTAGVAEWDFAQPRGRGSRECLRLVGTKKTVRVCAGRERLQPGVTGRRRG